MSSREELIPEGVIGNMKFIINKSKKETLDRDDINKVISYLRAFRWGLQDLTSIKEFIGNKHIDVNNVCDEILDPMWKNVQAYGKFNLNGITRD